MSFILDALKKSESDRQQQGASDFANVPSTNESPGAPRWLWVLGFLLAVNVAVLLGVLLRDDTPEAITPAAEAARVQPGAAAGTSFSEQIQAARQRDSAARSSPAAGPGPAAERPPGTPSETRTPTQPQTQPDVTSVAPASPATQSGFTLAALPTAEELRANGQLQIAELHLDIHVYSEDPAERFVFINMVRHREKSRLAEGPVVQEITPEGVILDYQGTRFLLPRE